VIVEIRPARLTPAGISASPAGSGHAAHRPSSTAIARRRIIRSPPRRPRRRGEVHGGPTVAGDVRDEQQTAEQRNVRAAGMRPRHRIAWMAGQR